MTRPANFEFIMDFLGDPEATELRRYVEGLEAAAPGGEGVATPEPVKHHHEAWWLIESTVAPRPLYYAGHKHHGRGRLHMHLVEEATKAVRYPDEWGAKYALAAMLDVKVSEPVWPLDKKLSHLVVREHIFDYTPIAAVPMGDVEPKPVRLVEGPPREIGQGLDRFGEHMDRPRGNDEAFYQFQRDRIEEARRHDAEEARPKLTPPNAPPNGVPPAPYECKTEAEKTAFAFGYWRGVHAARAGGGKASDAAWVRRIRETATHLRENSIQLTKYPFMADEARARELAALYIHEIAALHEAEGRLALAGAAGPLGDPEVVDAKGDYCPEKLKPGGCQLHNLHCGFPKCNEAPRK